MQFVDRTDAGQKLSETLSAYRGRPDVVVLGLPRGGVVVAAEVARELGAPLDIVVPRKIGAPGNPEFAIGAITETGERVLNDAVIAREGISEEYIKTTAEQEQREAERRLVVYRKGRDNLDLTNKTVIVVDDGIATGLTMQAAIRSVRQRGAAKIVVAVPVAAQDSLESTRKTVDEVVCLHAPVWFTAVGSFYRQFDQTTDEEVVRLLQA